MIVVGSDFSGVGAFNQALNRLGIDYKEAFACDMDKHARKTFVANYGEPAYYPENVYDRVIPGESLDVYMTSPPCQGFSIAGKREGSILFFNSHEFIKENKPRFFIFENVKGLLSHNKQNKKDKIGETFREWLDHLGGKTINGEKVETPHENAVPYHIYWKVLNSKKQGTPQNRERVFIVGIRDDADNVFQWPAEKPLTRKLKDCLESEVDEKYFLSEKMVKNLLSVNEKPTGFTFAPKDDETETANTITARCFKMGADDNYLKIMQINPSKESGGVQPYQQNRVYDERGIILALAANLGGNRSYMIAIKSATKQGYELATENDSINFSVPNSGTRRGRGRGRVGKEVAQTLDTACNQGVCVPVLTPDRINKRQNGRRFKEDGEPSFTITTQDRHGIYDGYRIRRLTPVECFRLQSFPDSLVENARRAGVSDSQLYKQAGNSIDVNVLAQIIAELPFYKNEILAGI